MRGGGPTGPSRGREIFQQKNICDHKVRVIVQNKVGQVAELVYALVLGTNAARLEGSSPSLPTRKSKSLCFCEGRERFFIIFIYKN